MEPTKEISRFEIIAALQEIGLLLQLKAGDPFRARAYTKAAQAIVEFDGDFPALVEQKRLTDLKGIGQSLAGVIDELYATGRSSLLLKLRAELPPAALTLSQVPGLTLKKIKKLNDALGVSSIGDLRAAIESGKLRDLPGFGVKTERALLEQISRSENRDNRMLLIHALGIAEKVIAHIRSYPDLVYVDVAGSSRRWKETISAIRITASASRSARDLVGHFLRFPLIAQIENQTETTVAARLLDGARIVFSVAPPDQYWNLLHHETGSRAHLKQLAGVARTKGIELA